MKIDCSSSPNNLEKQVKYASSEGSLNKKISKLAYLFGSFFM